MKKLLLISLILNLVSYSSYSEEYCGKNLTIDAVFKKADDFTNRYNNEKKEWSIQMKKNHVMNKNIKTSNG